MRLRPARTALRALALGLALAAVSDLLFAVGAALLVREPGHPLAYRNGGAADLVVVFAYLLLGFGLLVFPLDTPLFAPDEAARTDGQT